MSSPSRRRGNRTRRRTASEGSSHISGRSTTRRSITQQTSHQLLGSFGDTLIPIAKLQEHIAKLRGELHDVESVIFKHGERPLDLALIITKEQASPFTDIAITRGELQLDALLTQRTELLSKIDLYTAALAPQRRLPPELIRLIFITCVEESVDIPPKTTQPPLLLCRICSAWRQLALRTPQLWNNIIVSPVINPGGPPTSEIVRSWFARAQDLPLHLSTQGTSLFDRPTSYFIDLVWTLILPYANRFRKLDLTIPYDQVQRLFAFPAGSLTGVEEFVVNLVPQNGSQERIIPSLDAFTSSSRLSQVVLQLGKQVDPHILQLPWTQLTKLHFNVTRVTAPDCLRVLGLCSSLKDCRLIIQDIDTDALSSLSRNSSIELPVLEIFDLTFTSTVHHESFLHSLVVPGLRAFHLGCIRGFHVKLDGCLSLLRRSKCNLEELDLGRFSGPNLVSAYHIFENVPSLKGLTLPENVVILDGTLKSLSESEIGPHIEYLILDGMRNPSPILTMAEVRQQTVLLRKEKNLAKLKRLRIMCDADCRSQNFDNMNRLKSLGIDVILSSTRVENPFPANIYQ